MSRIHEALKKAEVERVNAPAAETPAAPFRRFEEERQPELSGNSPVSVGVLTESRPLTGSMPVTPLRDEGMLKVSDIFEQCAHPSWDVDPKHSVFADPKQTADGAEQFRTLRSRLYQLRGERPSLRTLLITSALPGEGKTFVTSNLGQAIVRQHERRALIIDGDLRRSNLHTALRAPSSPGLSDYLSSDADLLSVVQQGLRGNLCLIPGGRAVANPSELLANGRLKTLIDRIAHAFDWILIDSPPYLPVADASILADVADGVLLVVKARSTPSDVVEKASRELRGRNLLGVVMNGVEERALGYRSHYGAPYQEQITGE